MGRLPPTQRKGPAEPGLSSKVWKDYLCPRLLTCFFMDFFSTLAAASLPFGVSELLAFGWIFFSAMVLSPSALGPLLGSDDG